MAQHASLSVMLWIKSGTSESEAGKGERISAIPATKRTTLRNAAPLKFETIDFPSPVESLKENDVYFVTSSLRRSR